MATRDSLCFWRDNDFCLDRVESRERPRPRARRLCLGKEICARYDLPRALLLLHHRTYATPTSWYYIAHWSHWSYIETKRRGARRPSTICGNAVQRLQCKPNWNRSSCARKIWLTHPINRDHPRARRIPIHRARHMQCMYHGARDGTTGCLTQRLAAVHGPTGDLRWFRRVRMRKKQATSRKSIA